MSKKTEARVVEAVGVAVTSNSETAQRIEAAMQQALRECLDQGISDPDAQRKRMLAARDAALNS